MAVGALAVGVATSHGQTSAKAVATASAQQVPSAAGEPAPMATDINETIARVHVDLKLPDGRLYGGDMIVTHFRPAGNGPFPVVIFSHGRTSATRQEPARWRALSLARYWTRRGFAVLVPTRVGYGELGQEVDPETSGACANANYLPVVTAMATQIAAAAAFARDELPWADGGRIVLAGVSYGGFATIAAAAGDIPGVIGAINFVGGLGGSPDTRPGDPCQAPRITAIVSAAGAKAHVPMLWLYAQNDRFWGEDWPHRWHQAFTAAGGQAEFAAFGLIGEDGHKLLSEGFVTWRPVVDGYLARLGFPAPAAASRLPSTGFAALDEADKVPFLKPAARTQGYARFLQADVPRAFAVSPSGAWAWRSGSDAVDVALNRCRQSSKSPCSLYAVDDRVVWKDGHK